MMHINNVQFIISIDHFSSLKIIQGHGGPVVKVSDCKSHGSLTS